MLIQLLLRLKQLRFSLYMSCRSPKVVDPGWQYWIPTTSSLRSESKELHNQTVVFAILIGQMTINTSSELLPVLFLDVDASASEELLTTLVRKSQLL